MSEPTPPQTAPVEHNLLIEFLFRNQGSLLYRRLKFPIQHVPFRFGVRITNIGAIPFVGATITGFKISSDPLSSSYEVDKQVAVRALNPNESVDIWLGGTTPLMEGTCWVSCVLSPTVPGNVIKTFQKDAVTGAIEAFLQANNQWGDGLYIQRQMELLQARTNTLILLLTGLMFVDAVFGLRIVLVALLDLFRRALVLIANILPRVGS
jgi:hypothetical protein